MFYILRDVHIGNWQQHLICLKFIILKLESGFIYQTKFLMEPKPSKYYYDIIVTYLSELLSFKLNF